MKKFLSILLAFLLTFSLAGCTKKQSSKEDTSPKDALEILTTVWSSYSDDNKFQAMGGDYNNMTDNKPGKFDVSDTESLCCLCFWKYRLDQLFQNTVDRPISICSHLDGREPIVCYFQAFLFYTTFYRLF